MRVGFVGVGRLGAAMAQCALNEGHGVVVFDVDQAATSALAERGAEVAESPRLLAERCEIAAVVVLNDEQVREVVCGESGLLAAEGGADRIVIHSTIQLPTLAEVETAARSAGRILIDAGVSGGVAGAVAGELAIMVGGEEEAILGFRPLLEIYGGLVVRVGGLGAGMKAKVARNLISFGQCAAAYEGMRVAEEAGVDLASFARIVRHSENLSGMVDGYLSMPTVRPADSDSKSDRQRLAQAPYIVPMAEKDLAAAIELGRALGLDLPVASAARDEAPATWGGEPGPKV